MQPEPEAEQVIKINLVRPGQEDEVVRLEPQLTVSEAKEELSAQLNLEGPLQLGNVLLRSAKQLEIGKLYTLRVQSRVGHAEPADSSFAYLQQVMATQSQLPPTYEQLSDQLSILPQPLPILPQTIAELQEIPHVSQQLPHLAVSTSQQPARRLALCIASAVELPGKGRGEHLVVVDAYNIMFNIMRRALELQGFACETAGNVGDPSGAPAASKRPDLMLFLSYILMFKAELKEDPLDFESAVLELKGKMADWTPLVHGPRDYMLAAAAAGHRLRFCAVRKGGRQMKYISQEFDLHNQLHRLQVIHSSIGVLTIILQQHNHQRPSQPMPLGMTFDRETSKITYYGQHVIKEVPQSMFTKKHWSVLKTVYTFLLERHGPQASQGLIRPIANPQLKHNTWRVKLPLGSPFLPQAQGSLQNCVRDVLLGLQALHAAGFVHCDIRPPNIIEVAQETYALIDFEHSGHANQVPDFPPLRHWPPECRVSGAAYTTAADIYGVGIIMASVNLQLDDSALHLQQWLSAPDPKARPSAQAALMSEWLI